MSKRRTIAYLPPSPASQPVADETPAAAGLEIVDVVRGGQGRGRASVAAALERIAAGDASVLLVARLADAASSARELVALLDWLAAAQADLVAQDVGLDTASTAGQRAVATLREVERWDRAPAPGRAPRGRPGLAALAPDLGARIAAMRERGASLQAIADALNADGVPTQRGGARWRPSSVQAALGYRRPRPGLPGAPPPPPPHGHAAPHPPVSRADPRRPARGRPAPPPPRRKAPS
jgi:DNA invertase Pin-like site-specific DNA recombinase